MSMLVAELVANEIKDKMEHTFNDLPEDERSDAVLDVMVELFERCLVNPDVAGQSVSRFDDEDELVQRTALHYINVMMDRLGLGDFSIDTEQDFS